MFDAVEVDVLRNYECMGSMTMPHGWGRGMCGRPYHVLRNLGFGNRIPEIVRTRQSLVMSAGRRL